MSDKRRGLGRGLGALIPSSGTATATGDRPVDVFFPGREPAPADEAGSTEDATGAGSVNGTGASDATAERRCFP